jgi:hypothetical protein
MNIRLLHNATTPRYSNLRGCATLPHPVQPWVIVPSLAWLGSTIASMTRHLHRVVAKSPRQHRRQHDSACSSRHSQVTSTASLLAWLDSIIASMTRYRHCAVANSPRQCHSKHDSTAPSSAWLGTYLASRPSRLSSTIADTTRQWHHTTAWSSTSTIYDFSRKQTRS